MKPFLTASFAALLITLPTPARADVPGPRATCDADGLGCTLCTTTPGADDPAYQKCVSDAAAKGLLLACEDGGASLINEYYCPEGVTVDKTTGCSIGRGAASGLTAALLAAFGILAAARRRSRPRA